LLYIVSTPIGNYADITLRALRILMESDYIVCEEYKPASRLIRFFEIQKELVALNEHNEKEVSEEIFLDLAQGKNISMISDCGTPAFADPGRLLINKCIEADLKIDFIPGANSVLAAVVTSGFDISRFYFLGFLSPKKEIRKLELKNIAEHNKPVVLLEAPYRLQSFLEGVKDIIPERKIYIGFDLTMETEKHYRGTASEILNEIGDSKVKGEFIIIIDKNI
jgi:16S rRNA (cytidine1402-2'-O)-methyltransferase